MSTVSKVRLLVIAMHLLLCRGLYSQGFTVNANSFFQSNVLFGKIDYAKIQENPNELNALIENISSINLSNSSLQETKAFYINAYNLLVIYQVVKNYPVNSPMDVAGFFKVNQFKIADELLTLDQIEFEKLDTKKDPRIHFALACAATSCPYLASYAYNGDELASQLEARAIDVLNRPDYVRLMTDDKKILVSKIFDWYSSDFTNNMPLIDYINQYRTQKIPLPFKIEYIPYNWELNKL